MDPRQVGDSRMTMSAQISDEVDDDPIPDQRTLYLDELTWRKFNRLHERHAGCDAKIDTLRTLIDENLSE
jgi:hypothetical protein